MRTYALVLAASLLACSSNDATSGTPDAASDGAPSDSASSSDASASDASPLDASDAAVTTPSIAAIAPLAVTQNTIASVGVDEAFTVTDPGGTDGIAVTASASDPAHVTLGTPSCNAGTCSVHLQLAPSV